MLNAAVLARKPGSLETGRPFTVKTVVIVQVRDDNCVNLQAQCNKKDWRYSSFSGQWDGL